MHRLGGEVAILRSREQAFIKKKTSRRRHAEQLKGYIESMTHLSLESRITAKRIAESNAKLREEASRLVIEKEMLLTRMGADSVADVLHLTK